MSLVTLSDAQDRAGAAVTQDMIDEEEDWLASMIGPLTGERTETFFLPTRLRGLIDGVYLSRRTDALDSFTSAGDSTVESTDWRLLDGYVVEKVGTSTIAWLDPLVATYTPNDESIVKGVIYDLLTYRQQPTNLQSIRIGQYSETFATGAMRSSVRAALVGKVLTSAGLGVYGGPFRLRHTALDRSLVQAAES